MAAPKLSDIVITDVTVKDIRFPTSKDADGSDAVHTDPDYSAPYVTVHTNHTTLKGYGLTFTLGRGNEICVAAIHSLKKFAIGQSLSDITNEFAKFYRKVTSDTQMRWLGPEKGVMQLCTAALLNAIWDLWAKVENKPVWKLLADLPADKIISCIDFRYITDALTPQEALDILNKNEPSKKQREEELLKDGYPAYTTSVGWLGYPDDKIRKLCKEAVAQGWTTFKMKVGASLEDDKRRAEIIRQEIGYTNRLAMDANQRWDVNEAIEWMKALVQFKPHWIEEPTSPDDVLGHATIAAALKPLGIGVATGEQCQNRVIFKQLLQANAISFCQIDSCRLGSVNENLAVILMAKKFGIPVCPHAGGVGLCEFVQHLAVFDYIRVSASLENRVCEYVDHLHEHFVTPVQIKNGRYVLPRAPGYSIEMKAQSLINYEFPQGIVWQEIEKEKKN